MNKRKDILDEISYKYLYQQDKASEMFLRMLWEYYAKNDLETESLLGSLFYTLYMIPEKLSYDEIVYKFGIGLTTLNRYRRRFNNLARKLMLTAK